MRYWTSSLRFGLIVLLIFLCQTAQAEEFQTFDGTKLFYRSWPSRKPSDKFVILFHGGHEHSGRFNELVEQLGREDITYFAWDARGHGLSPGPRGYANSVEEVTQDVDAFVKHLEKTYGLSLTNTVFLGHSVGSVTVISFVNRYNPAIRGMILGSPALQVKTYVPFDRALLRLLIRIKPQSFINSYVVASMLTHDPKEVEDRNNDKLITRPIGSKMLLSVLEEGERFVREASKITIPTLILASGEDWVVHLSTERKFFEALGSPNKEMIVYPGFFHEVFHEKERALPISKARAFLRTLF